MEYEIGTTVTFTTPLPARGVWAFGEVSGHGTCPFTGERLVAVRWPGWPKPRFYHLSEIVEVD
ncbi:hypothetical protein [Streptomyces sp. NPDC059564]|uniref:hypothetical protein n=1 Tax=Streptomyces sp. NPDC059564 TaxID=3346865 RepID=UPI00368096EF